MNEPNPSVDFEPPLATYVLPALAPLRVLPLAQTKPLSWNVITPERPRLVSHPIQENEMERVQSPPGEFAGAVQLVGSESARELRPSIPLWSMPIVLAIITISALGMLLFGPPSLMIQRSVAAKDRSAMSERLFTPVTSFDQPALPAVVVAPLRTAELITRKQESYVSVQASDRSWVVACADGRVLFSNLLIGGDRHTIKFQRDAIVRVGSAGSVQIMKDGKLIGVLGRRGEVRIVEFTPEDSHFLHGGEAEDCTHGH